MSNIRALPGVHLQTNQPDPALIEVMEHLLEDARSGALQCFVGTGFQSDGCRISIWATDHQNDVFAMMGAITFLQGEYSNRCRETGEGAGV